MSNGASPRAHLRAIRTLNDGLILKLLEEVLGDICLA
jgi:hypothetical protein